MHVFDIGNGVDPSFKVILCRGLEWGVGVRNKGYRGNDHRFLVCIGEGRGGEARLDFFSLVGFVRIGGVRGRFGNGDIFNRWNGEAVRDFFQFVVEGEFLLEGNGLRFPALVKFHAEEVLFFLSEDVRGIGIDFVRIDRRGGNDGINVMKVHCRFNQATWNGFGKGGDGEDWLLDWIGD